MTMDVLGGIFVGLVSAALVLRAVSANRSAGKALARIRASADDAQRAMALWEQRAQQTTAALRDFAAQSDVKSVRSEPRALPAPAPLVKGGALLPFTPRSTPRPHGSSVAMPSIHGIVKWGDGERYTSLATDYDELLEDRWLDELFRTHSMHALTNSSLLVTIYFKDDLMTPDLEDGLDRVCRYSTFYSSSLPDKRVVRDIRAESGLVRYWKDVVTGRVEARQNEDLLCDPFDPIADWAY